MKIWFTWILISIAAATASTALACKPAPLPACEEKDYIPLHLPSFDAFAAKVEVFQAALSDALEKSGAKGKNSCFNSNFAVYYVGQVRGSLEKNPGKICPGLIPRLKATTENLLNADSAEWKSVSRRDRRARLGAPAKEARAALEEFLHQH